MWHFLRNLLMLAPLVLWVGGGSVIAFWVAPTIFANLSSRTESGRIVGLILQKLDRLLLVGIVLLILSEAIKYVKFPSAAVSTKEIVVTILIVLLVAVQIFSMTVVTPKIHAIRDQIPSFDDLPKEDPLRKTFGMWHGISMLCMVICLGLGTAILCLYFVPGGNPPIPHSIS